MRKYEFRVSPSTIRKANSDLIMNGVDSNTKDSYNGIITAKSTLSGIVRVREISKDKINEAYEKSLKEYAEKL